MLEALTVAVAAALNRARGDDRWMKPVGLRGRPLYYVAPAIGLLALAGGHPWPVALLVGAAYLVWGLGAWGRWFDLGRLPDGYAREGVPLDPLEALIETAAGHDDHTALFLRHLIGLAPGLFAVALGAGSPLAVGLLVPFAAAIVAAYELAWRAHEARPAVPPILTAEVCTGALWGAFLVLL